MKKLIAFAAMAGLLALVAPASANTVGPNPPDPLAMVKAFAKVSDKDTLPAEEDIARGGRRGVRGGRGHCSADDTPAEMLIGHETVRSNVRVQSTSRSSPSIFNNRRPTTVVAVRAPVVRTQNVRVQAVQSYSQQNVRLNVVSGHNHGYHSNGQAVILQQNSYVQPAIRLNVQAYQPQAVRFNVVAPTYAYRVYTPPPVILQLNGVDPCAGNGTNIDPTGVNPPVVVR